MTPDPTEALTGYLGMKTSVMVAGFAGGVVSLSYLRELSCLQMGMAVLAGTVTSGYLTPLAQHWITMPTEAENAVAFLIGLTAMNIVPGFLKLSEIFKRDPRSFFGGGGGPGNGGGGAG